MEFQEYEERLASILNINDISTDQISNILILSREYEHTKEARHDQLLICSTIIAGGMLSENTRLGDSYKTYTQIASEAVALAGMITNNVKAYCKNFE